MRRSFRTAAGLALALAAHANARVVAHRPPAPPVPVPTAATPADAPARSVTLSIGAGQLVRLSRPMTDLFVANDKIADVQVRNSTTLFVFGKGQGETTVYATDRAGGVIWSGTVRVGQGSGGVATMLRVAMPGSAINATMLTGMIVLTGDVAGPGDVAEAQRLVEAYVGPGTMVVNRLRSATPLQVNLRVKIAEVNRSVAKTIGMNLATRDNSGGFLFNLGQGSAGTITAVTDTPSTTGLPVGGTSYTFNNLAGTALGFAGHAFGLDILSQLQLAETQGLVTTLAEPNLTAISGEAASFLVGGEIPIPQSQGLGSVSVEYKPYGVSLSFVPTVHSDGRISLHVSPEVSQLSDTGSVKINGFTIPALSVRRAETTVELGSGQSFAIGGLLQNTHNNSTQKAPFLGDLPIIGALFRSNDFQRSETELVIVVTPYLVQPVDAKRIALPTDGYRAASDIERVFFNKDAAGTTGATPPRPTAAATPSRR